MSAASEDRGDRLSLQTLVISSLAAGAAAVVVPLFWERGTLLATAITPVIVALVSEGLRRPAERIGEAAAHRRPQGPDRPPDTGRGPQRLKRALTIGVLAFAIAAVVLTVSELSLGGSVSGDGDTTLFDDESTSQREQVEPSPSPQEPGATATATPEATPTPTPTPTPDEEATPTPTPTPPSNEPVP